MKKIGIISNNKNLKAIRIAKKIYDYLVAKNSNIYLLKDDSMPKKYSINAISEIEFSKLFVQWVIVAVITGGFIVTLKDRKNKKPKDEQKE